MRRVLLFSPPKFPLLTSSPLPPRRTKTSCIYTNLGTGQCLNTSCPNENELFGRCLSEIAYPHDECADNCNDDPSCLAYSQSVSYSSGSSGVTVYNVCIYYAETTPDRSDGERWGLGTESKCMVKVVDECFEDVVAIPPSPSPTGDFNGVPPLGDGVDHLFDGVSKPLLIMSIVSASIVTLMLIVFAYRKIRSKVIFDNKSMDVDGMVSSPGAVPFGNTNEKEREEKECERERQEGKSTMGSQFASVFGVGWNGPG